MNYTSNSYCNSYRQSNNVVVILQIKIGSNEQVNLATSITANF